MGPLTNGSPYKFNGYYEIKMLKKKPYNLENKIAWITGAASGLGKALAIELDRKKMVLVLIDKNADGLSSLETRLTGSKEHFSLCINLGDQQDIIHGLDSLADRYRNVDVLINCAAFITAGYFEDIPFEGFQQNYNVNFNAPLLLIKHAIKPMKLKKEGQIVNITSAMGRRATPLFSSYCVTKASLNALTDSIRAELATDNINVMSVSPSAMATDIIQNSIIFSKGDTSNIKFPKMKAPEIVARKIVKGLEKRASRIIQFSAVEILLLINIFSPSFVDWIFKKTILDKAKK